MLHVGVVDGPPDVACQLDATSATFPVCCCNRAQQQVALWAAPADGDSNSRQQAQQGVPVRCCRSVWHRRASRMAPWSHLQKSLDAHPRYLLGTSKAPPLSPATALPSHKCGVLLVVLLWRTCSQCLPRPAQFGVLILLLASSCCCNGLPALRCLHGLPGAITPWLHWRSAAAAQLNVSCCGFMPVEKWVIDDRRLCLEDVKRCSGVS